MTVKEIQHSIKTLKKEGYSEEEILMMFGMMYVDDKINLNTLQALYSVMGYVIPDEMLEMPEEYIKLEIQTQTENYKNSR